MMIKYGSLFRIFTNTVCVCVKRQVLALCAEHLPFYAVSVSAAVSRNVATAGNESRLYVVMVDILSERRSCCIQSREKANHWCIVTRY
jgi:hypothetical protein